MKIVNAEDCMNENYQIIRFYVEYAISRGLFPNNKIEIFDALLWLERLAALDYEINARNDALTEDKDY